MPKDLIVNQDDSCATSQSLLERAKANEPVAWQRLVSLYTPLVGRWCRRWRLQDADLADVLQDLFLAVSQRIGEFQSMPDGSFRGWLRTIAYHKVCDHWKRQRPEGGSDAYERLMGVSEKAVSPPSEANDSEDESELFRRAVDLVLVDFEERTGRAFWMLVVDGRSASDVAAELGVTANSVHLAKARVLARLREEFGDLVK